MEDDGPGRDEQPEHGAALTHGGPEDEGGRNQLQNGGDIPQAGLEQADP
jgi:hypothetical protein